MGQDQAKAMTDAPIDYRRRYQHQVELERVLRVRVRELEESVAEAGVDAQDLREELNRLSAELRAVDGMRSIGNAGVELAIAYLGEPHVKRYPKHKDFGVADCTTCARIRRLNDHLVKSERPTSRMALAS